MAEEGTEEGWLDFHPCLILYTIQLKSHPKGNIYLRKCSEILVSCHCVSLEREIDLKKHFFHKFEFESFPVHRCESVNAVSFLFFSPIAFHISTLPSSYYSTSCLSNGVCIAQWLE